ncbi:hypothetical protein [Microbacterium sp.]|uniref:hypothetical protein n=1 Tax=Microbacterium sp. TaxID=51671 RepID=UPI0025E5162A|nr:hypothetical protein [Microbacterium sp.]
MRVELDGVAKGRRDAALPPTSLTYSSGRATLATAETEQRPTVLGLIASGRMAPDAGAVSIDGAAGRRAVSDLRRRVALVDAPDVSDPAPNVTVAGVVGEELMFAGLPADPISARRWLHEHGLRGLSRLPIGDLAPRERIRILLELAAVRPRVDGLVLVAPDRHGGDPSAWWSLAEEFAARGLAVLVIAGEASRAALTAAQETSTATGGDRGSRSRLRPSRVRPSRRRTNLAGADLAHSDLAHPDREGAR